MCEFMEVFFFKFLSGINFFILNSVRLLSDLFNVSEFIDVVVGVMINEG